MPEFFPGSLTKNKLKVETTLVGAGVCGSLFALLGGQPLLIVGTTGPIVLFEKILYDTAVSGHNQVLIMAGVIIITWTSRQVNLF